MERVHAQEVDSGKIQRSCAIAALVHLEYLGTRFQFVNLCSHLLRFLPKVLNLSAVLKSEQRQDLNTSVMS